MTSLASAAAPAIDTFVVPEVQRIALQPLADADADAATTCARAALDLLLSEPAGAEEASAEHRAPAALQAAPPKDAEAALQALAHTLFTAARLDVTPDALTDKLKTLALNDAACSGISSAYTQALPGLRAAAQSSITAGLGGEHTFAALSWRLDVRLASRAARQEASPSFLLQLDTRSPGASGDVVTTHWMEADYNQMSRLNDAVSDALRSAQSSRRLSRVLSR